jgi:hypothetical protein
LTSIVSSDILTEVVVGDAGVVTSRSQEKATAASSKQQAASKIIKSHDNVLMS